MALSLAALAAGAAHWVTHTPSSPAGSRPAAAVSYAAPASFTGQDGTTSQFWVDLSADDNAVPPGCLEIVGKAPFPDCKPCPPLWLGGPGILCVIPNGETSSNASRACRPSASLPPCGAQTMPPLATIDRGLAAAGQDRRLRHQRR